MSTQGAEAVTKYEPPAIESREPITASLNGLSGSRN
jgi:hypothetical protein